MILIKKEKFQINGNQLILSSNHKQILRMQEQLQNFSALVLLINF